jgi:hypothetical protein
MLFSALISLLIGVVLARRFKVLVLAPAFILTLVLAIGAGLARTDAAWAIGSTALVVIVGLQIGYLFGSGIRLVLVAFRANRPGSESFANTLLPHRSAR